MRLLLVHCHPSDTSYSAALRDAAVSTLRAGGHEVELVDLYREGFDPVMAEAEHRTYLDDPEALRPRHQRHVDALLRAEGVVFVHPTWWYGPPAMLKGWLERTWLPGVAFSVPKAKGEKPAPALQHLRWLCGITTSGSPRWWLWLIRDPGRTLFVRGLRALMARRCRITWLQLYSMDNATDDDRRRFLERVRRTMAAVR